jgi:hypothetical protein
VHKFPARVQCTVQVCKLAVSNLHPPPYRSRQIICLSHSESVRLPLQLPMRPSPQQLHAGPFHPVHACTAQQHTSSHTVPVHGLCTSGLNRTIRYQSSLNKWCCLQFLPSFPIFGLNFAIAMRKTAGQMFICSQKAYS